MSRVIDYRIDRQVISMYYHRLAYILSNRRVHSVINDITCQVARAGNPEAAPPVEEANQVPPGELIELDMNRSEMNSE